MNDQIADVLGEPQPATLPICALTSCTRLHQGLGQRHRPEHVAAELGASLRLSRDAARLIIGGPVTGT
jgi:hypothetical protein